MNYPEINELKDEEREERAYKIIFTYVNAIEILLQSEQFEGVLDNTNEDDTLTLLLMWLGSTDFICQTYNLENSHVIQIMKRLLGSEIYNMKEKAADEFVKRVVEASQKEGGKILMKKGAECLSLWANQDPSVPDHLISVFNI